MTFIHELLASADWGVGRLEKRLADVTAERDALKERHASLRGRLNDLAEAWRYTGERDVLRIGVFVADVKDLTLDSCSQKLDGVLLGDVE